VNFVVRHESKITDGMNKEVTEATENGSPDARSLRSSQAFVSWCLWFILALMTD